MSQTFEFYDERAKTAAAEAEAAMLDNVRDRALRSEAAWRQLATRAQKTERDRAIRNAKAAETAEENRALQMAATEQQA